MSPVNHQQTDTDDEVAKIYRRISLHVLTSQAKSWATGSRSQAWAPGNSRPADRQGRVGVVGSRRSELGFETRSTLAIPLGVWRLCGSRLDEIVWRQLVSTGQAAMPTSESPPFRNNTANPLLFQERSPAEGKKKKKVTHGPRRAN